MFSDKEYIAEVKLGITTDTYDIWGNVTCEKEVNITEDMLKTAVNKFTGEIMQLPPMYSAIKQNGKKLYELARSGIEVERKERKITIYECEILSFDEDTFSIRVKCSKGTYIRTLCDDIGSYLGCFAHMGSLIRTYSGGFDIKNSYTIEELEALRDEGRLSEALIKTDEIFFEYEKIYLDKKESGKVKNGVPILKEGLIPNKCYRLYDENGSFLCVSKVINGKLKMQTSFWV